MLTCKLNVNMNVDLCISVTHSVTHLEITHETCNCD